MLTRTHQNNSNKYLRFILLTFTEIILFLNKLTLLMLTAVI